MDFNDLLNKLFAADPDCRKRRGLKIRTYVSLHACFSQQNYDRTRNPIPSHHLININYLNTKIQKVTPLNETSGLIEWVENLSPLRVILQKLHRDLHGIQPLGRQVRSDGTSTNNGHGWGCLPDLALQKRIATRAIFGLF